MQQSTLFDLIHDFAIILLDAPSTEERIEITEQIAADPELAARILLLFAEQIFPLLPPPATPTHHEEMLQ